MLWWNLKLNKEKEWMVDIVGHSNSSEPDGFRAEKIQILRVPTKHGDEINQDEYKKDLKRLQSAIRELIEFSSGDTIRK